MTNRKIGGNKYTKEDKYIKEVLKLNRKINKNEIGTLLKAFKKTILYFFENCEEFEFVNFFKFVKVLKKDKNSHITYLNDYILIPEHYEMKMQTYISFRDYVNKRKKFKDIRRRQYLPEDLRRRR